MSDEDKPVTLDLTSFELEQLLGLFIGILSEKTWQYMGLRLTPGKSEVAKDMVKARKAIDCVSYLTDVLAPSVPAEALSRYRSSLADLQLNYVSQS